MARINFDDNVEAQQEFWNLLPLVGGDRDVALGRLVRFFRLAQKAFGHDGVISEAELEREGLSCMIKSGWAVEVGEGFQAKGAGKHFAWYRQKIEAGKRGGRPAKAGAKETEPDANREKPDGFRNEPDDNRDKASVNPLALVNTNKENTYAHETASAPPDGGASEKFDLEELYLTEYPRLRGKQKGLAAARRAIRTRAQFEQLKQAIQNYAAECRRENRPEDKIKYFSSFMSEWRDWISLEEKPFRPSINVIPIRMEAAE